MDKKAQDLTVVLFGNSSAVGDEHIQPGQTTADDPEFSMIVPISKKILGRSVNIINIFDLQHSESYLDSVDQAIIRLINENQIHAFVFILQLGQLTDADKVGLEWLKKKFGESVLPFVMILFTYEREEDSDTIIDDLKKNSILEQLLSKCGDRYHICSKSMSNQSEMKTLLEKIDHMVSENNQCCYTAELYNTASNVREDLQDSKNQQSESCTEEELAQVFLQRLLLVDYKARTIPIKKEASKWDHSKADAKNKEENCTFESFFTKKQESHGTAKEKHHIHSMDVQMAVFHCSDSFLKQFIVTKLSQTQYALPLLVPNHVTGETEFPLWTFRQIRKGWIGTNTSGTKSNNIKPINEAETPMVFFFRFGSISSSKSQLINNLINEKHSTFFHRDCPGSVRDRLLMDGVVEITWYLPSGKITDHFTDCIAFCNLHGDAKIHEKQLEILTEMSSVNVVVLGEGNIPNNDLLKKLYQGSKPLVCLLCEDESNDIMASNLKYRIGLKDRNKSDISEDLRKTINECFSKSLSTFSLDKLGKNKKIAVDENSVECQKGKEAAVQIMTLMEGMELCNMKDKCLPCQGKLWHEWCKKKRELHRLQGSDIEMQKCEKIDEMMEIRKQQHKHGPSKLMELFIYTLKSLKENEKCYFLKWLTILLDNSTTDELSGLRHAYHDTWTEMLNLKEQGDKPEKIKNAQTQLEEISQKLSAASFGMEHILREMGQIYESFMSVRVDKNDFTLPRLAAEVMLSGHPLELMDGDTGHVPLIWVSAVLDELIKKLGNQRVFVLSVLGIQSSGKSTMLNAMFGLQFAVSAGRCTRGAFMQLVKVSEEMKLKFNYIVVVDTEGLRALEFTGMSRRQQDNELATFVVGLGNMTLINIFGENQTELQDILQIVVQAFMRMKKVRLNPSCMFVHQNVGEVTAGEKNMEGRKCLLDKLDKMTKLAAKEEDCNAKCLRDIIAFNVQSDVWYFTQLWEGSPPMAPPNPSYCQNIQELKQSIISKISKSRGVTLSEFKDNFSSLWNALLDENFVFSFRNILEIALYRKLEHEYSKWTWSLRSAMLAIENRLHNRVNNENSINIDKTDIMECMNETKIDVETSIKTFFDEDQDKDILIQWQERFQRKIADLCNELVEGTKRKLDEVIQLKIARKKIDCEKKAYESKLFKLSKDLAKEKKEETKEEALEEVFEDVWSKWVTKLTRDTPSFSEINIWGDVTQILSESYDLNFVCKQQKQFTYKRMDVLGDYSDYVVLRNQVDSDQEDLPSTNEQEEENDKNNACAFEKVIKDDKQDLYEENCRTNTFTADDSNSLTDLIRSTARDIKAEIQKIPIAKHGYSRIYIPEIIASVKEKVKAYESSTSNFILKKEFTVDLCLYVCKSTAEQFAERHKEFKEAYDVRLYLEKQRPQYLNIFKNYCNGATSTAVFGQVIVDTLELSILQAAYDQTAIDLSEKMKCDIPAFNGNRSNLEKHILTSLAEEESFENYIEYIQKPREHFNNFIKKKVTDYIFKDNCSVVLETIKTNVMSKGRCVVNAVNEATEKIKSNNGDVSMWLKNLSRKLQDELQFEEKSCSEQKKIKDLDFLQKVVIDGVNNIIPKLSNSFQSTSDIKWEMFRKKPDDILIEHLCRCCWAQCPFCNAICTNTMEDHTGNHNVRFHRNPVTNGWSFKFTKELGIDFCTTLVSSNLHFQASDRIISFKEYRTAGGEYAKWNISPDNSEMPYWKWFVCRFQKDLEKYYTKKFINDGEIPKQWKDYTKEKAIESLSEL
ncbi:hypothetical protein MHYP_G00308740 [Metynnis hypsauchen]